MTTLKRCFLALLLASAISAQAQADTVQVRMDTSEGQILIELYPDKAPVTVANFLRYVDAGHYNGATFYRTVTFENDNGNPWIEVIQGGIGDGPAPFPPIQHESTATTGLKHLDGTISMGRVELNTAASEFFICIGDQPGLDHGKPRNADGQGFAAFGRVIAGMNTVRAINKADANGPADSDYTRGQILTEPVRIESVTRVDATE